MSVAKAAVVTVQSRAYTDYEESRSSSEYSTGADPSRQPLHDFGSSSTPSGDNASSPKFRGAIKKFWKRSIAVHSRRKESMDDVEQEVKEGLLGGSNSTKKSTKTRPWYIYCMFGGLGCLTLS